MPDERTSSTLQRVAGIGASLVAGWLVHKLIDAVWRRAVGHPTPDTDDEDRSLTELAVATAVTGALVALTRLLATRGAARLVSGSSHTA